MYAQPPSHAICQPCEHVLHRRPTVSHALKIPAHQIDVDLSDGCRVADGM